MKHKHIAHEFLQLNHARPEIVFPLLCPVREGDWAPGWKYSLLFSESGYAEAGCVFTTTDKNGAVTTWICTHHDPARNEVEFAWVLPEVMATRVMIKLRPSGESETHAHVRYEYTALSEAGDRLLEQYDRAWFEAKMRGWERAINHYLRTGACIAE